MQFAGAVLQGPHPPSVRWSNREPWVRPLGSVPILLATTDRPVKDFPAARP